MIQAMYSGISGMKAFKSDLDVIGNNIANINTTGYKASRATFKELMIQTIAGASAPSSGRGGTNPSQIGLGVMLGGISTDQNQGSMQATGRNSDIGIEGNGFFALGNGQGMLFTRDGAFALDAQNNLVSIATGLKVLGWTADIASGTLDTATQITGGSAITIPIGGMSLAKQTNLVEISSNLNAAALVDSDPKIVKFDIYDSLGVRHAVTVEFTKIGAESEWQCDVYCEESDAAPGVPVATMDITFDERGHCTVPPLDVSFALAVDNDPSRQT